VNGQSARVVRKNSGVTQLKASSSLGVREVDSVFPQAGDNMSLELLLPGHSQMTVSVGCFQGGLSE